MATRLFLNETTSYTSGYARTEKSANLPLTGTFIDSGKVAEDLTQIPSGGDDVIITCNTDATTAQHSMYAGKWISDQLIVSNIDANTWTFTLSVREGSSGCNAFLRLSVYVLKNDDTVRGYVIDGASNIGAEVPSGNGLSLVYTFSGSQVTGIQSTDRLVIEVWFKANPAMAGADFVSSTYAGEEIWTTDSSGGIINAPASFLETPQTGLVEITPGQIKWINSGPSGLLKTSATSFTLTGAAADIGDTIVGMAVGLGTTSIASITDSVGGNTWAVLSDNAAQSMTVALFACVLSAALISSSTITITWNAACTAHAGITNIVRGVSTIEDVADQITSGNGQDPAISITPITNPTLLLSGIALNNEFLMSNSGSPDIDSLNGFWIALRSTGTTGGSEASNVSAMICVKFCTGIDTQTHNNHYALSRKYVSELAALKILASSIPNVIMAPYIAR